MLSTKLSIEIYQLVPGEHGPTLFRKQSIIAEKLISSIIPMKSSLLIEYGSKEDKERIFELQKKSNDRYSRTKTIVIETNEPTVILGNGSLSNENGYLFAYEGLTKVKICKLRDN